ncbi:MAG TPA: DUF6807 family protein [Chthoniobacteraceae bacterium]|jgi:hypothetical protein
MSSFRSLAFFAATLLGGSLLSSLAADEAFSFREESGVSLDVLRAGQPVARYMCGYDTSTPERRGETYKPYLHVLDAEGLQPITKGPGGEFTHHRGIFIGWNKLSVAGKVYDRWHMKDGAQIHRQFLAQKAEADQASFTSLVQWQGKGDETILEEERTHTFSRGSAPVYLMIDVSSRLKAVAGEVKLDGDREHAGVQFRASGDVELSKTTFLLPTENADPTKDHDYPWFAESFTLRGKRYSVAYLNHPANPTGTEISAYRPYGRFGAFFRDTIPANGERTIRVRFLVMEGDLPAREAMQGAYDAYVKATAGR